MENPFATSRNGHTLLDVYNPAAQTFDILYKGLYPSNVLSNLYGHQFLFDGVWCASMEGFLQSLKYCDVDIQRQICALKGGTAKDKTTDAWRASQTLWWRGASYLRHSPEFFDLVSRAYASLCDYCYSFRYALLATRDLTLIHSIGEPDPTKTILTPTEFCSILTSLRSKLTKQKHR